MQQGSEISDIEPTSFFDGLAFPGIGFYPTFLFCFANVQVSLIISVF